MVQFPGRQIQPFRWHFVMPNEMSLCCLQEPPPEQQRTGRAAQGWHRVLSRLHSCCGTWSNLATSAAVATASSASFSVLPSVTDGQFTIAQLLWSTGQSLVCCSLWARHSCINACSLEGRFSSWTYPATEGRPGFSCHWAQGPAHFQTLWGMPWDPPSRLPGTESHCSKM